MKEKEFENQIRDYLKKKKIYHFKFWGGKLKINGRFVRTKAGVADLNCCVNGVFVGIEVKQENGTPDIKQIENAKEINKTGGLCFIVYPDDFELLKLIIESILKDNSKENINKQRAIYFNTSNTRKYFIDN